MMLWSLWACKETAYKVIGKEKAGTPFLPRQWSVQFNQSGNMSGKGEVITTLGNKVFVRLFFAESYVHCTGSDNSADLDKISWGIESLPETRSGGTAEPSLFVRECLCRRISDVYHLNFRELEVRRAKKDRELQPPCLYYENKKASFDISLSHDGQFAAYAFRQLSIS